MGSIGRQGRWLTLPRVRADDGGVDVLIYVAIYGAILWGGVILVRTIREGWRK